MMPGDNAGPSCGLRNETVKPRARARGAAQGARVRAATTCSWPRVLRAHAPEPDAWIVRTRELVGEPRDGPLRRGGTRPLDQVLHAAAGRRRAPGGLRRLERAQDRLDLGPCPPGGDD